MTFAQNFDSIALKLMLSRTRALSVVRFLKELQAVMSFDMQQSRNMSEMSEK